MNFQAVASDIDKEEKAIKAGIHRSELFYDPVSVTGDSKSGGKGFKKSLDT